MRQIVAAAAALACLVAGCASAQDIASSSRGNDGARSDSGGKNTSSAGDKRGKRGDKAHVDRKGKNRDGKRKKRGKNLEVKLNNVVGKVRRFSSPSTNIGCQISGDGVRCDIDKRKYRPTRKPRSCNLDYGNAFAVGRGEPAFACVGDTVLGAPTQLAYGTATRVGKYGCQSRRDGMRCYNLRTGRGFLVSRSLYEFY